MTVLIIILTVLTVLVLLYILSTVGRVGHPELEKLRGFGYAHRGLHGDGVPENSLEAFRKARDLGFGLELDVHLMADGQLAVIHDSSLKRTAGADVKIEDLTAPELSGYFLEGTWERIPLFSQVLDLYEGKAPLIVELKPEGGNHAALCQAVCDMLEGYRGTYCLESFDPRCILWLRKHRPHLIRGQLSEDFVHNPKSTLPLVLKLVMTWLMPNFLTRPDFVAYRFSDRKVLSNQLCRRLWKLQSVTWTVTRQEDYDTALREESLPIFEGFLPHHSETNTRSCLP